MKVLQIGLSRYPGGIENFIFTIFNESVKLNITFDFVDTSGELAHREDFISKGSVVYDLPDPKKAPVEYKKQLTDICRGYDIVAVNMLSAANILPLACARDAGVPGIIAHAHSSSTEGALKHILHRINKKKIANFATDYFTCSNRASSWLFTDDIIRSEKIKTVRNCINTSRFHFDSSVRAEVREAYGIPEDAKVICHVGRHTREKNIFFLLKVMKELTASDPNFYLILVGDGVLTEKLKAQAAKLGLEKKVIFTGHCETPERIYFASDFYCLPSVYEGLNITAVEAQATGLYCILSDLMAEETKLIADTEFLPLHKSVWKKELLEKDPPDFSKRESSVFTVRRLGYGAQDAARQYCSLLNDIYSRNDK